MVRSMIGEGTLRYDDGETFDVDAHIEFRDAGGRMGGAGTIRSADVFDLAMRAESPVLECSGQKIRIAITNANGDGVALVKTSGAPITD